MASTPYAAMLRAQQDQGVARLSDGRCPFCDASLSPLTDEQRSLTAAFYAPPSAHCVPCAMLVGRYPAGGGIFVGGECVGGFYGTPWPLTTDREARP